MKKSWILIILSLLLISSVYGQIYTQTHSNTDGWTKNSPNEDKGWGMVFQLGSWITDNFVLHNITFASDDSATAISGQICLFNYTNKDRLKCVGTGSKGAVAISLTLNYTLVPGNEYVYIQHHNGSFHQIYYEVGCCSHPENSTESDKIIQWNIGQYVTNVAPFSDWNDYTDTSWTSGINMVVSNASAPAPPPPPTSEASISCSWNATSNTNHTENPYFFAIDCIGNVGDTGDLFNVSLFLNNTLNATTEVALNSSIFILNLTYGDEQVAYEINFTVDQGGSNANATGQFVNFFIDSVDPELSVSSTVVNNSVLWYNIDSLDQNFTATDPNLFAMNISYIKLNDDGSYNTTMNNTFIENLTVSSYTISNYSGINAMDLFANNYTNGSYQIQLFAWDSHTDNQVRPIYWNLSDPDKIKIEDIVLQGDIKEDQTEFLLSGDRYKFKITFEEDLLIQELTITATGDLTFIPGSNYKGHFVHFDSKRWIDFDGSNIKDVQVKDLGSNTYHLTIELYTASDEVEFESIGDLNEASVFYYFTVVNPFSFTAKDVFTNISLTNFTIKVFNETDFTLIQTRSTSTGAVHFNITDGLNYLTNITSSSHADNQTEALNFSENGNFTYLVFATNSLYIFVYDEITDQLITDPNITIKIINYDNASVEQKTSGGSLFYSGLSTGSYELRYSGSGFNTRSYYTQITSSSTQMIELFLLNSTEATYTAFIIEDETGNTLEGTTLQAYRHFIDCNCFKVIEMDKSTFNGIATISLQQHEARYRFIVLNDDGSTIYSSTSQEGYKITDTAYTLTATLLGDTTASFFGTANLFTNLSWSNSTKQFYFTVNDPTALVDQFCVYVNQYDLTASSGKNEICSNCVNGSTGIAMCNVSSYVPNGKEMVAQGWIHTNTQFSEYWTDVISVFTDFESVVSLGTLGVFLGTILIMVGFFAGLVLAGLGGAIMVFDVMLIFVSMLNLIVISLPVLLGVIATSIFVLILTGDK